MPLAEHCFAGPKIGEVRGLAAAPDGSVWMTGVTATRFVNDNESTARVPYEQAFVVRFQPLQGIAEYATLLSTEVSRGNDIAIGPDGVVYSTGETTQPKGSLRSQAGGLMEPTKQRQLC